MTGPLLESCNFQPHLDVLPDPLWLTSPNASCPPPGQRPRLPPEPGQPCPGPGGGPSACGSLGPCRPPGPGESEEDGGSGQRGLPGGQRGAGGPRSSCWPSAWLARHQDYRSSRATLGGRHLSEYRVHVGPRPALLWPSCLPPGPLPPRPLAKCPREASPASARQVGQRVTRHRGSP